MHSHNTKIGNICTHIVAKQSPALLAKSEWRTSSLGILEQHTSSGLRARPEFNGRSTYKKVWIRSRVDISLGGRSAEMVGRSLWRR